jgi:hypothetical protein
MQSGGGLSVRNLSHDCVMPVYLSDTHQLYWSDHHLIRLSARN